VILGKAPVITTGETPNYSNYGLFSVNAGFKFSMGNGYATFPRNGLAAAYDFYDHGGDTGLAFYGWWHDVGLGGPIFSPVAGTYATPTNGQILNPGQGTNINSAGIVTTGDTGYGGHWQTFQSELYYAFANAPAAMQVMGKRGVTIQ
jgi:hypothetical protein